MPDTVITKLATIEMPSTGNTLHCRGDWTLGGIAALSQSIKKMKLVADGSVIIDGSNISQMDSAGAMLMKQLLDSFALKKIAVTLEGFSEKQASLVQLIQKTAKDITQPKSRYVPRNIFYTVGKDTVYKCREVYETLGFLGELAVRQFHTFFHPRSIKWRAILVAIENTGYRALPIVALLQFLVGIVLSYQMGLQLRNYGADLFIVNVTGHAILREFGPLITGIIAAGRTSSAYTAEIGTMKVNEEIDALTTMGLSAMDWLVSPKIIGTLIALPLLTAWADAFGIFGAMFMSKLSLGISYTDFLSRFDDVVPLKTYIIGLTKAPVFAAIVALTGCFQGFRVDYNAESVGHQTTVSVVQAIFLLIVTDSIFSIYFNWAGI